MEENKNIQVTFGLQPNHIKIIEERINHWNKPLIIKSETYTPTMQFSKAMWEDAAKLIGWEPFTLCLKYFEYLHKNNQPPKTI